MPSTSSSLSSPLSSLPNAAVASGPDAGAGTGGAAGAGGTAGTPGSSLSVSGSAGTRSGTIYNNSLVVESAERYTYVGYDSLYSYSYDSSYNYIVTIDGQTLDYITFDTPTVTQWADETVNMVNDETTSGQVVVDNQGN